MWARVATTASFGHSHQWLRLPQRWWSGTLNQTSQSINRQGWQLLSVGEEDNWASFTVPGPTATVDTVVHPIKSFCKLSQEFWSMRTLKNLYLDRVKLIQGASGFDQYIERTEWVLFISQISSRELVTQSPVLCLIGCSVSKELSLTNGSCLKKLCPPISPPHRSNVKQITDWYTVQKDSPLVLVGFPGGSDGKESTCNAGDLGSIPGLGRAPGEENRNPLQYSCLENPMDRGVWQATVHGVTNNQTWLSD